MDGKKVIATKKKSIKSIYKNIVKKVKRVFNNLIEEFKKLDPFYKKIIYIWAVVLILLTIVISTLSVTHKDYKKYEDFEAKLKQAAIDYAKDYEIITPKSSPITLQGDLLKEYKYILEEDIPDNSCVAYAKAYYVQNNDSEEEDGEYFADAYINCKKYTTEGFSKNK